LFENPDYVIPLSASVIDISADDSNGNNRHAGGKTSGQQVKRSLRNRIRKVIGVTMPLFGLAAIVSLFLTFGFNLSSRWMINLLVLDEIIAVFFVVSLLFNWLISDNKWLYIRQSPIEFILLLLFITSLILEKAISIDEPHYLLKTATSRSFIKLYFIIIQVYIAVNGIISLTKTRDRWLFFSLSPARILMISYLIVIMAGTLMLKLPKATYSGITWIDGLFTSTSAVCITGLSTVNIHDVFTFEGQVFILLLIQLGGLGIITLTSFIALFIQRGFRLKGQIIVQEVLNDENFSSLASILKAIVAITFITELAGAAGLYLSWGDLGMSEFERIFSAVFHSVSAYCNAGFSIFPNGLETAGIQFHFISLITIMLLIVLGGLGFYTYSDILHIGDVKMFRKKGLTLQTRIILISTLVLIISGALLVWIIQYSDWKDLPVGKQLTNAFFLSITSRTAGFSTVPISELAIPTLMLVLLFMYIGGAPNSTTGGIKLTTMVTILAGLRTFARGKSRVEIGWNTIPMRTVRRAFIVLVVSIILVFFVLFVLTWTEKFAFFDILFEIMSAFGTVGLSRGITPDLTLMGRIMIILVMFAGRIGLFTFVIAMSEEAEDDGYSFPEINLMVG
jgi:potassium uptake TrkH family protein